MSFTFSQPTHQDLFSIRSQKELIMRITRDGDIFVLINGELTKIEDKKEIGYAFALTIANMNNIVVVSKETEEDIIWKIVSHYRDRQLNKIIQ